MFFFYKFSRSPKYAFGQKYNDFKGVEIIVVSKSIGFKWNNEVIYNCLLKLIWARIDFNKKSYNKDAKRV